MHFAALLVHPGSLCNGRPPNPGPRASERIGLSSAQAPVTVGKRTCGYALRLGPTSSQAPREASHIFAMPILAWILRLNKTLFKKSKEGSDISHGKTHPHKQSVL